MEPIQQQDQHQEHPEQNQQEQHNPDSLPSQEELTQSLIQSLNTYIETKLKLESQKQPNPSQPTPKHQLTPSHVEAFSFLSDLSSLTEELSKIKMENDSLISNAKNLLSQLYEISTIRKHTESLITLASTSNSTLSSLQSNLLDISKALNITNTQPEKEDEPPSTASAIRGVEHVIHINNLHEGYVYSLLELTDKRIATGSQNGTISICAIDYNEETWSQSIKYENAHSGFIFALCELKENTLVSGSNDAVVKVWKVLESELTLLKELNVHSSTIWKIITLTQNRWASCSTDRCVKICSNEEPYDIVKSLNHSDTVYSVLQLKNKEVLVASCGATSIEFWDLKQYVKEYTLKGIYSRGSNHMIELQNGNIAVSSEKHGKPILVIDPNKHAIVKEITEDGYIPHSSTLCTWGDMYFFYAGSGCLLQISSQNYRVLFKSNSETQLRGNSGVIAVNDGKYLIIDNDDNGVEIFEIY